MCAVIMWEGRRRVFCYVDSRNVGGWVQDSMCNNTEVTFISSFIYFPADMGKEGDGAAIFHHHNNVRAEAAGCDVGMLVCEGGACVYLDVRW